MVSATILDMTCHTLRFARLLMLAFRQSLEKVMEVGFAHDDLVAMDMIGV